jgi:hypothetical protein
MVRAPEVVNRLAAWTSWAVGFVLILTGVPASSEGAWAITQVALGGVTFGIIGLILTLRTRNVVGWLSLGLAVAFGLSLHGHPGLEIVAVASILLLFPTGRLPSPRWRIAAVALVVAALLALADMTVGLPDDISWLVFMVCVVPVMLAGAIRIVANYRRAGGEIRQQLKWVAWVLGIGAMLLTVSLVPIPYLEDSHELAGLVLLVGSPVAIALAVSRYRLYEVDRLISRTVTYAVVLAVVGATYIGTVALIASQLEGSVAVASGTLVAAAVFQPLRRRIERRVDRRFNRSRYDAERVATEFSGSLRDQVDVDTMVSGLVAVVASTLHPRSAGVWIRTGSGPGVEPH